MCQRLLCCGFLIIADAYLKSSSIIELIKYMGTIITSIILFFFFYIYTYIHLQCYDTGIYIFTTAHHHDICMCFLIYMRYT